MPATTKRHQFTVEDYYKMAETGILRPEDRVELINGEIIHMSPIKSLHAAIVADLVEMLNLSLRGKAIVRGQSPVRLSPVSEPEPDVAVVKLHPDRYRSGHPAPEDVHLLVEVSDSTLAYDRRQKLSLYAEAGISQVWIVNLQKKCMDEYTGPQEKNYSYKRVCGMDDTLTLYPFDVPIRVRDIIAGG